LTSKKATNLYLIYTHRLAYIHYVKSYRQNVRDVSLQLKGNQMVRPKIVIDSRSLGQFNLLCSYKWCFVFILQPDKQFIPGGLYPGRLIYITATPGPVKYVNYSLILSVQMLSFTDVSFA